MTLFFFFFKQKTAYEMRISDWSSDVCSSDLAGVEEVERHEERREQAQRVDVVVRRQPRHADAQQARDQAGDEGADKVINAELVGDEGGQETHHHQQRELRTG